MGEAFVLRTSTDLYRDESPLWPDEIYPNRVNFEIVIDVESAHLHPLDPRLMEALRRSANTMGVAVAVPENPLILMSGLIADDTVDHDYDQDWLDHDVGDALATVLTRCEQRKIRDRKFGTATTIQCDICGRRLPARFVRAAHIKPRSKCTLTERRDLQNIMAACLLGCDEMFEHGYISVDAQGRVITTRPAFGDLATAMSHLEGRTCQVSTTRSPAYFEWHHKRHATTLPPPSTT